MSILWRNNGTIQKADLNITLESNDYGFLYGEQKFLRKNYIHQQLWIIENTNLSFYLDKQELQNTIEATVRKILSAPDYTDKIHKETIRLNRQYFALGERIRKLNLSTLTNQQLLSWQKKLYRLQILTHGTAMATTWFADCDSQSFSKHLRSLLGNKIAKTKLDPADVFSALTTPNQESLGTRQEIEFLKIIQVAGSKPKKLKGALTRHHHKWCWMPYGYTGPAYGLDYYLEVARGLIQERINPAKEIEKIRLRAEKGQTQRKQFIKQLALSAYEKHLFDIAADIVWLKGFRKDCYFHGFFVSDLLLAEIGKRTGLSLLQAKYLAAEELPQALAGKDFSDVTNERLKLTVVYSQGKHRRILTGQDAKKLIRRQKFEKIKVVKTKEMSGTCACGGTARGTIRVVNAPEDMAKMKNGDIMIAHATYPSLVPAMKKAAAILTEEGGITCHAAIVSRELQTPCVVGIPNLLALLEDGDKVEIDANKGTVKKL